MKPFAKRSSVFLSVFLWFTMTQLEGVAAAKPPAEKAKSRLEELFLWKISDSLELNATEEESFRNQFKLLSDKKNKAAQEMDRLTAELEGQTDLAKISRSLKGYNDQLMEYNSVQAEEIKVMRRVLGDRRFSQYLILKRDLNQKFKNLLSTPSRPESYQPKE